MHIENHRDFSSAGEKPSGGGDTTPDLVPDSDVLKCRGWGGGVWSIGHYVLFFSWSLSRSVTTTEAYEIISKLNGYGPHEEGMTYGELTRSDDSLVFWRNP